VPSASELRLIIAASLKLIISRERAEALSLAKIDQLKSSAGKAAAHASALGQGLLASGADLLNWLGNINDVVNPLWQLKRQVDAALIIYEECRAASNGCLSLATRARYLKRVELADHQALVEALGFDPATIDLDAFSQAWHSAWVLAGDKQVVALIGGFAKDYIEAQHALEYSQAAGNAVFEVLLALLLAAATAGTGLAMGMASKERHAGEFGRVGRRLVLLAEALEGSPREIVRRRGEATRVVDGGSDGRKGRASQQLEKPELQAPTDKVAVLPVRLVPNNLAPEYNGVANDKTPKGKLDELTPEELELVNYVPAFKTKGVSHQVAENWLINHADGKEYFEALRASVPNDIPDEQVLSWATDHVRSGASLPEKISVDKALIKIIPKGNNISDYQFSPFLTTKEELLKAQNSDNGMWDSFGLPMKNDAFEYDVYELSPKEGVVGFLSKILPTEELGGRFKTNASLNQVLLPSKNLFGIFRKAGSI